uniref:Uncharacterized protein n=1 Tax=Anguilla anguilla TaxID=7936 RepID=A0A0E9WAL4_ANGAN
MSSQRFAGLFSAGGRYFRTVAGYMTRVFFLRCRTGVLRGGAWTGTCSKVKISGSLLRGIGL